MDNPSPTFDPAVLLPERSFGYRLWMLRHAWTRRLEAAIEGTGLTHMQFFALRALDHFVSEGETPSQTHLADAMHVDRMTVSKLVRTLEAKGLVVRDVHPDDPRANSVVPSPAGLELARRAAGLAIAEQDRFFGRLGAERMAALSLMLDELLAGSRMKEFT